MLIVARRIIRSRGSQVARLVGGNQMFNSVEELLTWAKRRKVVFAFVDSNGNEGTIRSGRLMRRVDQHVKNTIATFTVADSIQRPLDIVVNEIDSKELVAV